MAQGRQQNNGSRQRCAQSAAAKAPAEPPKAVCAQLEQMNRKLAAASAEILRYQTRLFACERQMAALRQENAQLEAACEQARQEAECAGAHAGAGGRTAPTARARGSAACSAGLEAPDQIGAPLGGADELVRRYDGRMMESWMICKKADMSEMKSCCKAQSCCSSFFCGLVGNGRPCGRKYRSEERLRWNQNRKY